MQNGTKSEYDSDCHKDDDTITARWLQINQKDAVHRRMSGVAVLKI